MTKSVIIDGIEYVPKAKEQAPKITGINVSYEPIIAGPGCKLQVSIPVKVEFTVVNVFGNERTVELPYRYGKDVLEAIL